MPKKDFLDQFSTDNVPDSFKKEELKPVAKKKINPAKIIIIAVVFVLLIGVGIFVFFYINRPKIELPNFVGMKTNEVSNWIKQQEIEPNGIIYKEEYSEDYDEKVVIYQSIVEGTKVKNDVKLDLTVSLGPDPNMSITVPDISSMNLTSIKDWMDTNKLRGVKLNYEFSDTDPLDSVISFVFGNNVNESNFTRSSSLTITISKGKQSDQSISVPNFVGKNVSEVITWGSKNKIKIEQKEEFSPTVSKDLVIEQSVNTGKKISSKEILTVTVSRGEAIYAPDFTAYSQKNIDAWATKNLVNIEFINKYSSTVEEGKVITQDHKGEPVNDGMTVTISLGEPQIDEIIGKNISELTTWIEKINKDGAGISSYNVTKVNDEYASPDTIISGSIKVGSSVDVVVSKGRNIWLQDLGESSYEDEDGVIHTVGGLKWEDVLKGDHFTEQDIRSLIARQSPAITNVKYVYKKDNNYKTNHVISVVRMDTKECPEANTYLSQNVQIVITICEKGYDQ